MWSGDRAIPHNLNGAVLIHSWSGDFMIKGEYKLIGDIGECIVKYLIESMEDWECISYGVEHHIKVLKDSLSNNHEDDTSKKVRNMPDFVAYNKKTKKSHLIEVKLRTNPDNKFGFSYSQIKDYCKFWKDSKMIVISPKEPYFDIVEMKDVTDELFIGTKIIKGRTLEEFNFNKIRKDIQGLFPELTKENIENAIKYIPFRQNNSEVIKK